MKIPSAALEQRKEILKAFAAKHCVSPDLCEQVCVEDTEGKVLFYVCERRPVSEATAKVMDGVIRLVCERCGNVSPGVVLSDGRRQELVTARNIIVLILREHYRLSLHDCGTAVNRHHPPRCSRSRSKLSKKRKIQQKIPYLWCGIFCCLQRV